MNKTIGKIPPLLKSHLSQGKDRLNNLKKVMFEHGSGTSVEYLKKVIGSHGTKLMKERTMQVDPELVKIFKAVESIANSE